MFTELDSFTPLNDLLYSTLKTDKIMIAVNAPTRMDISFDLSRRYQYTEVPAEPIVNWFGGQGIL